MVEKPEAQVRGRLRLRGTHGHPVPTIDRGSTSGPVNSRPEEEAPHDSGTGEAYVASLRVFGRLDSGAMEPRRATKQRAVVREVVAVGRSVSRELGHGREP